ncbi:MAG: TolC family protein [Bilophila wadsworthia]
MRDALTRQQEMSNVVASLERMVKSCGFPWKLANTRYDNGYSSYLEVLDAERSLFDSEMQLAAARSERLSSIVNVCLALGGGWK